MRGRRRRGARRQAFDVIVRCLADTVGADTAMLLGRSDDRTEVFSSWAREGHELQVGWTSGTLLGQAFEASGPLLEPSTPIDGEAGVEAIATPIRYQRDVLGAVYAGFSPETREAPEELGWTVDSYARMAALCMTRDITLPAVLGSVGFDVLTGCLSYGGLLEVLKGEIQRSMRGRHRLSCCFLDLDGFKDVNDSAGHLEGNRVLTSVGHALRSSARTYDAIARFGGDEFVVVLPETDGRAGRSIARRYRAAVVDAIATSTAVQVGVSAGVAEWDGSGSATDLLGAADAALGRAKANGGGTVAPATAEGSVDGLLELTKDLMRRRRRAAATDGDMS